MSALVLFYFNIVQVLTDSNLSPFYSELFQKNKNFFLHLASKKATQWPSNYIHKSQ